VPETRPDYDAVIVGAGPNGLSAATEIARAGHSVLVLEAADTIGGGARTQELTLPGFRHDVCSAIHPMGVASPFFATVPLAEHGLEWVHPRIPFAHPFDDGTAVFIHESLEETANGLGLDAAAYRKLMGPLVRNAATISSGFLAPLLRPPRHPLAMARFGLVAIRSADKLLHSRFKGERARAMLAGNAAHAELPLDHGLTAAFAIVYNILAHSVGWPVARGGSQAIVDALASYLGSLGGRIECGQEVASLADVPPSRVVLFDLAPRHISRICSGDLPSGYRRRLDRFEYGTGVFKIDWALDGPIPWKAEGAHAAGTFHLGASFEEIAASERATNDGQHPERPWVIVAQPSTFDASRAPAGKHTLWGYCHVPRGSTVDMTDAIESQLERFAPGFRDLVIGRHTKTASDLEAYNANYIGGDIASGSATFRQMIGRPVLRLNPHATPNRRLFICSSSTPPGPGVHGMCGYFAAKAALRRLR
jgi:phytoene dehydrogenase-like protein